MLTEWIGRLPDVQRRHGTVAMLRWIGYRVAKRLVNARVTRVFWLQRGQPGPAEAADRDVAFRFLTAEEVRQLAADRANDLEASLADRIASGGGCCYAAFADRRLATYAWFGTDRIEPYDSADAGIACPADVAYLYKAFTHPDFRGRRLYGALVAKALGALADRNIDKLLCLVEWTNEPALRSCRRSGWIDLGRLVTFGYGRHRAVFAPRNAGERGIVFGWRPAPAML